MCVSNSDWPMSWRVTFSFKYFEGPWRHKGARNKLKILIESDMVKIFRHDTNIIYSKLKNVSFQVGLVEIFWPCQKFFFQRKNSNRSKQTTAKCKQIGKKDMILGIILSYYNVSKIMEKYRISLLPKNFLSIYFLRRKLGCEWACH